MESHRRDGKRRLELLKARKTPAKFRVDNFSAFPFIAAIPAARLAEPPLRTRRPD